jgi:hypothetical protein
MNVSSAGMVSVVLPDVSGFSSANINYSLNAAAVGVDLPLSLDASNIQTGTLPSGVLPLATGSSAGAIPFYEEGTFTAAVSVTSNVTGTATFGPARYKRIGNMVFCTIDNITGFTLTSATTANSYVYFSHTGLPEVTNGTFYFGAGRVRTNPGIEILPSAVSYRNTTTTDFGVQFNAINSGASNADGFEIYALHFYYHID